MNPLVNPTDTNDTNTDNPVTQPQETSGPLLPNWAYGVIAAGSVLIAGGGVVTYHAVSKKKRQQDAIEHCKNISQTHDQVTPRGDSPCQNAPPVSKWAPRPNEKIV